MELCGKSCSYCWSVIKGAVCECRVKKTHHDELLLEQCGMELLVRIKGVYHNEDRTHLFIEVMGEVTKNQEATSILDYDR